MFLTPKAAIVAGLFLFAGYNAGAQTGGSGKSGTITFEAKPATTSRARAKKKKYVERTSALTAGLLTPIIHGFLPVYFERGITSRFSVQVGVGPTWRSFANDIGTLVPVRIGEADIVDPPNDYTNYTHRNAGIGYMFSVSPRLYNRNDDMLNGQYVGLSIEHKRYNFAAQLADPSVELSGYSRDADDIPHLAETQSESFRCTDILCVVGSQVTTGGSLIIGWSVSVGVRMAKSSRLSINTGGSYPVNGTWEVSDNRPMLQLDFTLGRAF